MQNIPNSRDLISKELQRREAFKTEIISFQNSLSRLQKYLIAENNQRDKSNFSKEGSGKLSTDFTKKAITNLDNIIEYTNNFKDQKYDISSVVDSSSINDLIEIVSEIENKVDITLDDNEFEIITKQYNNSVETYKREKRALRLSDGEIYLLNIVKTIESDLLSIVESLEKVSTV